MSLDRFDVVVVGSGIVGASLALGLAQQSFRVAIIDIREHAPVWVDGHAQPPFDIRASSINHASVALFKHFHAWPSMQAKRIHAFREIQVWDAAGNDHIHFNSRDIGNSCLGYIIEHHVMLDALVEQLRQQNVSMLSPDSVEAFHTEQDAMLVQLQSGKSLACRLLVGADGSHSTVRRLAGIESRQWPQQHEGVVATVRMSLPHQHTAWQRFLPDGPLAFLPLTEHTCSIVWSCPKQQARALMAKDEQAFCQALAEAMENRFGALRLCGGRASFPLRPQHALRYIQSRLCLAGDAAHSIHPLAGQGVNLGLLDAAALIDVLDQTRRQRKDIGAYLVLRRYERWRRSYNAAMLQVMEGFAHLFGNQHPLLSWLRNNGLNLTDRLLPVKQSIMDYACGLRGDLPSLSQNHHAGAP